LPASRGLLTFSNIVFIITGVYFALVAGLQQGPPYAAVGALLCFVAAALAYDLEWFFAGPWRVASVVFCLAVLVTQLGTNFLAVNPSSIIVISTIVNVILFVALLGVLLTSAKEMVSREEEEEEEKEESEKKKKKLTYEI
jgi:cytochrome bd-type quinol oxidase subunit 1